MLRRWAIKLLLLLADKESPDDLHEALTACQSLDKRIEVIKLIAGESERIRLESNFSDLLESETEKLIPELLKNLRDRDGADTDVKMAYLLTHVRKHSPSTRDELVKGIREGIENGEFTPEDVAARLVEPGLGRAVDADREPVLSFIRRTVVHRAHRDTSSKH